ncbi:MAG: Fumarate hydratase class I, anaerobic [candidate division WS2 bacterium]|uniref:Fumarate hydratase class I, anaerobic n=1 Tax=Psychracetigena formicireducens TaxID=2986056 RepID=A0A9E2F5J2_PSYF1|nr:Fumarate hydratase class I, anaerobic [Candidatus Psychracetigena formicireducens]MBT9144420.1 Fumarate hydratase class I, anaerobic [Candidatus Psychracetigena formicireducens]
MAVYKITPPLTEEVVSLLKAGDEVFITGIIYAARDAAHKKLVDLIKDGKELPFDIKGQIVYYVGPSPAKPGQPIGSAGPTTSERMDAYTPTLLKLGLKGMIGKGFRSKEVKESLVKEKGVYFAAIGGAGALLAKAIKGSRIIAYEELGPETIRELIVEDFPAIVINDVYGNDLYEEGVSKYQK